MTKEKKEAKKVYNFGEKAEENWKSSKTKQWEKLSVWQTPKYLQSRNKAIELIDSNKYKLDEGDFWILKNQGGSKLCYTGLIISHNGCLKINDKLDDKMKFKPSCAEIVKDEAEKVKVMRYVNDDQGVYEFGEISPKNCMNDYPYAMVLKRLMDRVVLKNSKVGYFGIYSDSESEDFKESLEDTKEVATENQFAKLANAIDGDKEKTSRTQNEKDFQRIKADIEKCANVQEIESLVEKEQKFINKLAKYANDLFLKLKDSKEGMIQILETEEQPND